MRVQVLDFDLSASSHFLSTLYMRFGVTNQTPLLKIRGLMWLLHILQQTRLPFLGTFSAPWVWQIDGWMLCNSTWMFRVVAANDDDLVQKNAVWQGWQ